MSKINLIIAGGRDFGDLNQVHEVAPHILKGYKRKDILIISGTARGADRMGEAFAKEHKLHLQQMPARWDEFGKSAGYKRNVEMAKRATHLLAFWDGKSKGTKHMIDIAHAHGLTVFVLNY